MRAGRVLGIARPTPPPRRSARHAVQAGRRSAWRSRRRLSPMRRISDVPRTSASQQAACLLVSASGQSRPSIFSLANTSQATSGATEPARSLSASRPHRPDGTHPSVDVRRNTLWRGLRRAQAAVEPVLRVFFSVRVTGAENIPETGAVIIASNHQAFCDSLFIPLAVPRRVTFVAKADYFKSWKTRWFFRAIGQIPMERGGGKASMQSFNEALGVARTRRRARDLPGGHSPAGRPSAPRAHRRSPSHRGGALPRGPGRIRGTREVQPIGKTDAEAVQDGRDPFRQADRLLCPVR